MTHLTPNSEPIDVAISEVLQISEVLLEKAAEGFTEVVLRNPQTGEEKIILLPKVQS